MQVGVAEFLEKVGKLPTDEQKIEALKYNDSYVLRCILQGALDPNVEWLLPAGKPPYKPNELVDQEHLLIGKVKKLQYFVKGFYDNLNQRKREMMFVELLETIDAKDAELLCMIKEKQLPKGITGYHVVSAFPDLIPGYVPNKEDMKNIPFLQETAVICPHCGHKGKTEKMMKQYHFDNCKRRPMQERAAELLQQTEEVSVVVENEPVVETITTEEGVVYKPTDLTSL